MRTGLLTGLLVLALGSGALAQSPSASPDVTPFLAPDDLTTVLPTEVGDVVLSHSQHSGPDLVDTGDEYADGRWLAVLSELGKEPADLSMATAGPEDASGAAAYAFVAVRVRGVAASALMDRFIRLSPAGLPDDFVIPYRNVAGRQIVDVPSSEGWAFLYPVGEVMYMVYGFGEATIEDVLAELP